MARVLVVDDAAFMRKVLSDALAKGGHEVVGEAANGNEAVSQYQELHPDVTTLDITMPEKDGLEALREILASDPAARVVMCSALGQESKVLESIKSGAKDFVVKPFQADRVLEAVGKALCLSRDAPAAAIPTTRSDWSLKAPCRRGAASRSRVTRPASLVDEAGAERLGDGLRPRPGAELRQRLRDVRPHGLGRDEELLAGLVVRAAVGEQTQHGALALGERRALRSRAGASR